MNFLDMTVLSKSCVAEGSDLANIILPRANIIGMIQNAEDAVLRPKSIGAFGHDLRAAIAARVAYLADDKMLAAHYLADAGGYVALCEPRETGIAHGLDTVLGFVDKVANQTRDTTANDILNLQAANVSDADIVRLCELVAFLAFQVRVIAGLRLMQREVA